jgi:hypothetical protein
MAFIDQIQTDLPFTLLGADLSIIGLTNHLIANDRSTKKYHGLY